MQLNFSVHYQSQSMRGLCEKEQEGEEGQQEEGNEEKEKKDGGFLKEEVGGEEEKEKMEKNCHFAKGSMALYPSNNSRKRA